MASSQAGGRPARARAWRPRVVSDRRGATAALFAISLTALVGFAGLATEAGRWYDVRRNMQSAADLAAYAGARRIQDTFSGTVNLGIAGAQTQGIWAALDVASRNAFPNASPNTVTPVSPYSGNDRAIEVTITRQEPRLISGLFLSGGAQTIGVRAVAAIQTLGNACVLALQGSLIFGGNTTVSGPNCIFASNSTSSTAININGNPTVIAQSFQAVGGCDNCSRATLTAPPGRGYTDDPLAWAQNVGKPSGTGWNTGFTQPPNNIGNGNTWTSPAVRTDSVYWNPSNTSPAPGYYVFTGNVSVANGETMILQSGTYFFANGAALDVNGGNLCLIACSGTAPSSLDATIGVTLVFLRGTNGRAGQVHIRGNGTIQLQAPASGPYDGILFYRETSTGASEIGSQNDLILNGGSNLSRIAGAIYAPGADVDFLGNTSVAEQGCLVVIGGSVQLSGNSAGATGQCNILNPNIVPQTRIVRLIE